MTCLAFFAANSTVKGGPCKLSDLQPPICSDVDLAYLREVLRAVQTEQDPMLKLTVLTAAVAAGVMTFAIGAANGAPLSQRADQGFITASDKIATPKAGQVAKEKGRSPQRR